MVGRAGLEPACFYVVGLRPTAIAAMPPADIEYLYCWGLGSDTCDIGACIVGAWIRILAILAPVSGYFGPLTTRLPRSRQAVVGFLVSRRVRPASSFLAVRPLFLSLYCTPNCFPAPCSGILLCYSGSLNYDGNIAFLIVPFLFLLPVSFFSESFGSFCLLLT